MGFTGLHGCLMKCWTFIKCSVSQAHLLVPFLCHRSTGLHSSKPRPCYSPALVFVSDAVGLLMGAGAPQIHLQGLGLHCRCLVTTRSGLSQGLIPSFAARSDLSLGSSHSPCLGTPSSPARSFGLLPKPGLGFGKPGAPRAGWQSCSGAQLMAQAAQCHLLGSQ